MGQLIEECEHRRPQRARERGPFISILHVSELSAVSWHAAAGYRPTTPGRVAKANELIVSLINPSRLRATVIPEDFSSLLCSAEFGVFRTFRDPYEVLVILHHPDVRAQLAPLGRGTSSSRRRIVEKDVLDLLVPMIEPSRLRASAQVLRTALAEMRSASLRAAGALDLQSSTDEGFSAESASAGSGAAGS
jgi:hypothetical protein